MSESENFNRLIRLLARGGTMVLRRVLEKHSAPLSFSEYIYQNQGKILQLKFFENQRVLVVSRSVEKMDITLLGKLVMGMFRDLLTDKEKDCVNSIKVERDKFLHSETLEIAKVSATVFESRWQDICIVLQDLAVEIGDACFKTQLDTFIEETKRCSPDIEEIHSTLIEWCQSNKEIHEKIEKLTKTVDDLKGMLPLDKGSSLI